MKKFENMFFDYRYADMKGESIKLSPLSQVFDQKDFYAAEYAKKRLLNLLPEGKKMNISFALGFLEEEKQRMGDAFCENEEAYAIFVNECDIKISANCEMGLNFGAVTLFQLEKAGELKAGVLFDYPDKEVRGYRVFTPGYAETADFEAMVDMLLEYKYNTVMIEVGGAMEYKKHPKINEEWVKYCAEVNKSPYEAERIQRKTFKWSKNSIHTNNGGGGFISQEQMKKVAEFCKRRGFKVIPEVPSLSHSDYIVRAYPELNERKEDTYPDTYCPSNPKSYEVLFDILDEVIGVFEPEYINIGHDEGYTFAKCEKCRDKNPVDLFVGDITKINDYLRQKGIKAMMWGEKVYGNVYTVEADGTKIAEGGTGNAARDIPRLAECAGRIPKDVTLLQWYWSLCSGKDEKEIVDMGYKMIYGNFQAISLKDYRNRIKIVSGGFVSNWGSDAEEYMQRNGQNYSLLTTAKIFWSADYDSTEWKDVHEKVKDELYKRYKAALGESIIELEHTCDKDIEYKPFYDGYYIVPEDWVIGNHVVTYTDGTTAKLPIIYGYNIRNKFKSAKGLSGVQSAESVVSSDIEALGASYTVERDGAVFYKTAYKNPYPEKKVQNIACEAKDGIKIEAIY